MASRRNRIPLTSAAIGGHATPDERFRADRAPFAAANQRQYETTVSQVERLETQAETIGRQGAELERAMSTVVGLGALAAAESSRRRDPRRLLIALAVVTTPALSALRRLRGCPNAYLATPRAAGGPLSLPGG